MATYLLTWNPAKWNEWEDDGALDAFVEKTRSGQPVSFQWSTAHSRKAVERDQVFLTKLGRKGRGLFASGTVTKAAHFDPYDAGRGYVVIARWDRFLEPRTRANLLDLTSTTDSVLRLQHWIPESSGISIRPNVVARLENAWTRHFNAKFDGARPRQPQPRNQDIETLISELPENERASVRRTITAALRAAALRPKVLEIWPRECAACGIAIADADGNVECEVAHVHDIHAAGPDLIANTIPLCRTHHWAFDRHLWGIDPETLEIHVQAHAARSLELIQGRRIQRPKAARLEPLAKKHLLWRWKEYTSR